jgi:hypothetical protein
MEPGGWCGRRGILDKRKGSAMIFAARKLQSIGLIMLVTLCFLIAYPISLRVSATRAELRKVEAQIADAKARNRMLEGDIAVLANAHQLNRWNSEYLGYVAPGAAQYLPGERALASLDRLSPPSDRAPQAPVLVAMRTGDLSSSGGGASDDADTALSPAAIARERVAMVDRARLADSAMRDISRTVPSSTAPSVARGASSGASSATAHPRITSAEAGQ